MRIIKAQQTNLNNSHVYKRQWLLSVCCCVLLRKFILRLPIWKSSGLELPKLKVLLRVTRDILGVSSVLGIKDLLFLGVCFGGDGWRFGHDLQNFLILRIFNLKPFPCTVTVFQFQFCLFLCIYTQPFEILVIYKDNSVAHSL